MSNNDVRKNIAVSAQAHDHLMAIRKENNVSLFDLANIAILSLQVDDERILEKARQRKESAAQRKERIEKLKKLDNATLERLLDQVE